MLNIRTLARWCGLAALGWTSGPARSEVRATFHTIAVLPVSLPAGLSSPAMASARFDTLIVTTLRAQGFAVFSPDSTTAIWEHVRDSAGGYFDTYTGKVIEVKRQAVMGNFRLTLKSDHHAEAVLYMSISPVTISFGGGKVKWGGTEEESGGSGGVVGFLFGRSEGSISALTLFAEAEDMDGNTLYSGEGGIQLTQLIEGNRMVPVSPASLLGNMDRNVAAVHLALDSLARLVAPKGP